MHDLAYYWPHFTPITEPKSEDVMLFTLSKLTGHAGTRVGWAFVRDERVAEEMRAFVATTSLGVPHDAQLRASSILLTSSAFVAWKRASVWAFSRAR